MPLFQDTVSRQYSAQFGDGSFADLCGPQVYNLYELVNGQQKIINFAFLSVSGSTSIINVQTSQRADVGTHDMILEVTLSLYAQTLNQPFTIVIKDDECTITGLEVAPGQDFTVVYNIENPPAPLVKAYPELRVTPASC